MANTAKEIPNKLITSQDCKQGAVRAVRFNVEGGYCMTCGSDKTIKLWNPHKSTLVKTYSGHGYDVLDVQASCDNSQMCSGGLDKAVILWDVASGKPVRKFRGHKGHAATVNCVKFNEESTLALSGSLDGSVRIWDCKSRNMDPVQVLDDATDSVTCMQVSDCEILTGSADGKIRRYDIRMGKMQSDFVGKTVSSVSFTRDGQCTLVSTQDSTVRLLDKDTGELLNEFTGHKHTTYKVDSCLSHSDTHVLSGSENGKVYVWDLVEAKVETVLEHGGAVVHSLSFHPNNCCLLTACGNKIWVWKSTYVPLK